MIGRGRSAGGGYLVAKLSLPLIFCAMLFADTAAVFNPDLIILQLRRPAQFADSLSPPMTRRTVADSARILSPKMRAVLTADTAVYEIEPLMPVDSVKLFVRHSQDLVDTLGMFTSPPFRAVWDNAHVPGQDQIHLQFGYILYSGDSLAVASPPMPHRQMLDRGIRPSKNRYTIRQLVNADEFEIDGDLFKWRDVKGADIGTVAHFKLLWTSAKLYFIIQVRDSSITHGDFVELHLDMHRGRSRFSGINHRSLRFGPRLGRRSFVVDLIDSGFVYSDSINALLGSETDWSAVTDSGGYTIEAAIPFTVLSDIGFPPSKIGFDVSVMNVDIVKTAGGKTEETVSFYSWSGTERFSRYSPRGWGTAKMSRAVFALKAILFSVLIFTCLTPLFFIVNLVAAKRRRNQFDPGVSDDNEPLIDAVIECVDAGCADVNFGIKDVLKSVGHTEDKILSEIKTRLDCTFDRLLIFRRIKLSQKLMRDPDIAIDKIAALCGFADADTYKENYEAQMNVAPEVSRAALLEKIKEEEENDDDDDSNGTS